MRCIRATWCVMTVVAACAVPLRAGVPDFKPTIKDVTVFKDGHALIMSRGTAQFEDGRCRTRDVPVPVLGTFWTFVAQKDVEIESVRAGLVETEEARPCMTIEEMIEANVGREAVIYEASVAHQGTLLGILKRETVRDVETSRTSPATYDPWGRYIQPQPVRETTAQEVTNLASFVMVKTGEGVVLIKRANIRNVVVKDENPATRVSRRKKEREISVRAVRRDRPFSGRAEVGMVYLQRGIRWIPTYSIDLLDNGKARVTLRGTVINDIADMRDVHLRLVVGVPNFIMKGEISPIALREAKPHLSSYFAPATQRGPQGDYFPNYLSNAMMSQSVMPAVRGAAPAARGPEMPIEGQNEDLFIYHKTGFSLTKGGRATVKLFEAIVPYEDVYAWEIPPIPPREVWRHVGQQQQQILKSLLGAKVIHKIRLTNSGNAPWTTGPATILKDGTPLAQQLLTYTSVNNKVDVEVTVATDLNTKKEERETGRDNDARIGGSRYTRVDLHGKLTLTNFKDKSVRVLITRKVIGKTTAAEGGEISQANLTEDTSFLSDGSPWYSWYPWYGWYWPWWWYHLNPLSQITWEAEIRAGKSATFEYDWHYHYLP